MSSKKQDFNMRVLKTYDPDETEDKNELQGRTLKNKAQGNYLGHLHDDIRVLCVTYFFCMRVQNILIIHI